MTSFSTIHLPSEPDVVAPDGSNVRVLLRSERGSTAHFELPPGATSRAVTHRTVEEIWYCLSGYGEVWRQQRGREEVVVLEPGVCLTIPLGTHFQFRNIGDEPLAVLGLTTPPWPDKDDEATFINGKWDPTVS